jgi:hypothetical protein
MHNLHLAAHFHFDEADLRANRSGRLSDRQRERLITITRQARIPGLGCGLAFLAIASIFPIGFAPLALELRDQIGPLVGIALGVLVWVLIWGVLAVFAIRRAFSKPNLLLDQVAGPARVEAVRHYSQSSHSYHTAHELRVGGRTFYIDAALVDHIRPGDWYAVYFLKDTANIMSLEQQPAR